MTARRRLSVQSFAIRVGYCCSKIHPLFEAYLHASDKSAVNDSSPINKTMFLSNLLFTRTQAIYSYFSHNTLCKICIDILIQNETSRKSFITRHFRCRTYEVVQRKSAKWFAFLVF